VIRLTSSLAAVAVLLCGAALPAAGQRGEAYCHVTGITSEQVSNGVLVTIEADGGLEWSVDWRQLLETGAAHGESGDWGISIWGFTERFRRLPIQIFNARSKLGTGFVPIGKYPISHVEISIPEWADEGIGLEIVVVNYLGWVSGEGDLERLRGDFHQEASEDSSKIIVCWESDRFPAPPSPETPDDLPSELEVSADEGLLWLRAVNAKLEEVASAIGREAGFPVSAPPDDDLRVSAYLHDISPVKALDAVATGCGLCARATPDGGWVVAEPTETAGGYSASSSRTIDLHYLRAVDALDLLPNFLLRYLHADEQSNSIVVTGPDCLLDRVEEDLAKLDTPPPEVSIEAVAVEYTSAQALARALYLEHFSGDFAASLGSATGDLSFLWLEALPSAWAVLLENIEVEASTRLRSRASVRVANGRRAQISAGQERYIILETLYDESGAELRRVGTGTTLTVQPVLGRGDEIVLHFAVEVRGLRGSDPATGLPILGRRQAHGVTRVRDGETLLIAGLSLEEESREERGVPLLRDLPLLGELFRAPRHSRSEIRLAFFLTPRILRGGPIQEGEPTHG
jgi:type II secretory pathway component GspD/PulD (secretin)